MELHQARKASEDDVVVTALLSARGDVMVTHRRKLQRMGIYTQPSHTSGSAFSAFIRCKD